MNPREGSQLYRERATTSVIVSGLLCAALLVSSACKRDRSKPLPGQPTMEELMHRGVEERRPREQERDRKIAARKAAAPLTRDQAAAMEAELLRGDKGVAVYKTQATHEALAWYYDGWHDVKRRDRHVLWEIEHSPFRALQIDPKADRDGYERGKALWLAHTNKPGAGPFVFHAAASYFTAGGDKPLAETMLLLGRKQYPADQEQWVGSLARLYYGVLVGASEWQLGVVHSVNVADIHSAYAQQVRHRLEESHDPALLTKTGQFLADWGAHLYPAMIDFDPLPLATSYIDHALSIRPGYQPAQEAHARLGYAEDRREYLKALGGRKAEEALGQVGESERLEILPTQAEYAYYANNLDKSETHARELLTLSARFPHHRNYGNSTFKANMLLGKIALRRGDKRKAGRYLLEAANAPMSERLTYGEISMELPRALIDWGERDTVAEFLERCAKFNANGKQFKDWARQIREGINPNLGPSVTGCSKTPC